MLPVPSNRQAMTIYTLRVLRIMPRFLATLEIIDFSVVTARFAGTSRALVTLAQMKRMEYRNTWVNSGKSPGLLSNRL
jgi:hypothetical protein